MIFIAVALGFWIWRGKSKTDNDCSKNQSNEPILQTAFVDALNHGGYHGSTFFSMVNGLGAALTTLIVSTQPFLTKILEIFLFIEKPLLIQWIGIFIGFIGVIVVILPSLGINGRLLRSYPIFWLTHDYNRHSDRKTHWRLN